MPDSLSSRRVGSAEDIVVTSKSSPLVEGSPARARGPWNTTPGSAGGPAAAGPGKGGMARTGWRLLAPLCRECKCAMALTAESHTNRAFAATNTSGASHTHRQHSHRRPGTNPKSYLESKICCCRFDRQACLSAIANCRLRHQDTKHGCHADRAL